MTYFDEVLSRYDDIVLAKTSDADKRARVSLGELQYPKMLRSKCEIRLMGKKVALTKNFVALSTSSLLDAANCSVDFA